MQPGRPTIVMVVAILNIIFGTLGLLCNCLGGMVLTLLANSPDLRADEVFAFMAEQQEFLAREVPGYTAFQIGGIVEGLVLAILLIGAGIGLTGMRNWARLASIFYAVVKIIIETGSVLYTLALVNPAAARFQPQALPLASDPGNMFANILTVAGAALIIGYGILLLVVLLNPGIAAAFHPSAPVDFLENDQGSDDPPRDDRW